MTAADTDAVQDASAGRAVTATAPGKVNLHLSVSDAGGSGGRDDGYHDLETVFHALDLIETVTLQVAGSVPPETADAAGPSGIPDAADLVTGVTVTGRDSGRVPTGDRQTDNLAVRAVLAVMERYRRHAPGSKLPRLAVTIDKGVPVAGGMAGGSADAAATLVAARELLHGRGAAAAGFALAPRPGDGELSAMAADLGADVPFCLEGGTALGRGRGEQLLPVMVRGTYHWALVMDSRGLSTADVFARLDEQRAAAARGERPDVRAGGPEDVQRALLSGDPEVLAVHLGTGGGGGTGAVNDLQAPAISLSPDLRRTLAAGRDAGALACLVSGSGPTVAMLCRDRGHAVDVATSLAAEGVGGRAVSTATAASYPHGAQILEQ
ncbi:MAG: 4-(cytidine 5'-diphospho)-2-C-methyl-D-erythritol kinase [Mycobacteriaceae bacterium]|uniref:4-(cytidine 5'-diphospho)-2-C-methyl-D-erythritol kinase n=1 Tax=Corynebacterium sp. TaxID=1720 RepID=UPI003F9682E5